MALKWLRVSLLSVILPENGSFRDTISIADSTTADVGSTRQFLLPDLPSGSGGSIDVDARVDTTGGKVIAIAAIESASTDVTPENNLDTVITDLDSFMVTLAFPNYFTNHAGIRQNVPNPFRYKTSLPFVLHENANLNIGNL